MVGIGNKSAIETFARYTPQGYCQEADLVVEKGQGSWFEDIEGNKFLDFTSGIFTNSFGHCFEPLMKAEIAQIYKFDNVHGRRSLAELDFYKELASFMPLDDYKFIPYNDGGYAVDRALSDIVNYYQKKRIPIAAFRGGFHGKTMGTKLTINETEKAALFDNFQVDYPNCYRCPWGKNKATCAQCCVSDICNKLKERQAKAVIFEVVQGAGVIIPPQGFWQKIEEFCKENHIVMFADEVLTGGGRTGHFLAGYGLYGITPDVISVTKGLANGRPLSVICERTYITDNPYGKRCGERSSTFASHPVNMAVAAENLRCLKKYEIFKHVREMGEILYEELLKIKSLSSFIGDVRAVGLMAAIEFVRSQDGKEAYTELAQKMFFEARKNGVETILSGHILRIAPPLNITRDDLLLGLEKIRQAVKNI